MTEHVRIKRADGVLALTFARPERRNAITVAMYAALADAIEGAAADASVRAITIRGEGQDFTAGNDLADFLDAPPREGEEIPVWRLLRAVTRNRKPLIAAVQGNAVGIGTTLLLHCDLVVADANARFSLPFVDLGLVPEAASSLIIPRLAGRRRAAAWLLLGESFGAEEAREAGIVSHVASENDLEEVFADVLRRLLAKPAEGLQLTQELLRHGTDDEILERMELEGVQFSQRLQSREVKDIIAAFFAARAAKSA